MVWIRLHWVELVELVEMDELVKLVEMGELVELGWICLNWPELAGIGWIDWMIEMAGNLLIWLIGVSGMNMFISELNWV